MSEYEGKTVVVTGGGAGIGRAIATAFAQEGANVIIADIKADIAQETAKALSGSTGQIVATACDVSKRGDVFALVELAVTKTGRLDIMVNNAGIAMAPTNLEELEPEFIDRMMGVNFNGVIWGCQAALSVFKPQKSGVILNIASMTAVRPRPGLNIYGASKAAVIVLTKGIALEVASQGIRCLAINPVAADTGLLSDFIGSGKDRSEGEKAFASTIPVGRLCRPDDIANAALFLASSRAEMITGSCVDVDGARGV
ncbi:SDR family oxidoreductase [Nitratireductor kimnyeongensis]|uniref:SDR family oxidoreductase n=1 Tax=Nitratireductor kimnyeongensis TaxID=430679 RepID=A0ABW0T8X6_9HYPH|nr:SDR family oxidoreductase [Nitratireductor kimnyeongensis]QZZ36444.1 SDR family oxidoreductase [Nitratireductor kimnyeongensis]